jgi:hypothetical protein
MKINEKGTAIVTGYVYPWLSKKGRDDYDGSINGDEAILPVLLEAAEDLVDVSIVPLAISRQFVTTLCVRPCIDLFAVFIQLMNELSCFLIRMFGLGMLVEVEEEEDGDEETLPRVVTPPLLFFETANAV